MCLCVCTRASGHQYDILVNDMKEIFVYLIQKQKILVSSCIKLLVPNSMIDYPPDHQEKHRLFRCTGHQLGNVE